MSCAGPPLVFLHAPVAWLSVHSSFNITGEPIVCGRRKAIHRLCDNRRTYWGWTI